MKLEAIYGRAYINHQLIDSTIYINELGFIEKIERGSPHGSLNSKILKLPKEWIILPGIIDIHVHFRDWELSYKETLESGSAAAAYGGVVLAIDMPNTKPELNSIEKIRMRLNNAEGRLYIDYWVYSGIPNDVNEVKAICSSNLVAGFKVYPRDLKKHTFPKIMKTILDQNYLVIIHSEMPWVEERCMLAELGARYICRSRASMKECIDYILNISSRTVSTNQRLRIHVTHIPYHQLAAYVKEKLCTTDTCMHYVLLNSEHEALGCRFKVNPPLAPLNEQLKMLKAIMENYIDVISSDHAPHSENEKNYTYHTCPPGIAGIEATYRLLFTLVKRGILSLRKFVLLTSINPSKILNIHELFGSISLGKVASFTIINPKEFGRIYGSKYSRAYFTGFEGLNYEGEVVMTIVRGYIAYEAGIGLSSPKGITMPKIINLRNP